MGGPTSVSVEFEESSFQARIQRDMSVPAGAVRVLKTENGPTPLKVLPVHLPYRSAGQGGPEKGHRPRYP